MERIIFHIDVNNAFLSWTAVDMLKKGYKIDIRKRYSVIGGQEKERRGIVLAKSLLTKSKNINTGESLYVARKKCPYLEVYQPNYELYKQESKKLFQYLSNYTPNIEIYSIDECFIDYTSSQKLFGDPLLQAKKIKDDIEKNFGWTVNIGIANNKLCAKMASDFEKPNKIHTLFDNEISEKLWPLKVDDLFMIGKKTSQKLKEMNIKTIYDLACADINLLTRNFKSMATMMHNYANGIDDSSVETEYSDPKSISSSTILPYDYKNVDMIYGIIRQLSMEICPKLREYNYYANVVGINIKYSDWTKISKQKKLNISINTDKDIYDQSISLFNCVWNENSIRSIGIFISELDNVSKVQLSIFDNPQNIKTDDELQKTIDNIRKKYGVSKIIYGDMVNKKKNN